MTKIRIFTKKSSCDNKHTEFFQLENKKKNKINQLKLTIKDGQFIAILTP